MKERIYISGAITGTDDYMERFAEAENDLTKAGYEVVNPAKVNAQLPKGTSYDDYMKMSFCMLGTCDYIYMLRGWQNSKGANLELREAKELGTSIYYQPIDWREKNVKIIRNEIKRKEWWRYVAK